jgi:general L-amino acid transport system substrate-binding protein
MGTLKLLAMGAGLAAGLGAFAGAQAQTKSTLDIVKERGVLRCQHGQPAAGFYEQTADGKWRGLDHDMCRAIAAAVLGDANKIDVQSVTNAVRFTALANGESDVLVRTTTWTLTRDSQLGLDHHGVNFYDGQGFMVRKDSNIKSAKELNGATICVITGTTTELNLADYFRTNNMTYKAFTTADSNVARETYEKGGCDANTNDKSSLASSRATFAKPDDHVILPETISKEPLGPVTRHGDNQWGDIVKWSLYVLIAAEEYGLTSANVDRVRAETKDPEIRRMLGVEGELHRGLGLDREWAYRIVKQVGNYGESFERNVGPRTPLGIARDGSLNALWTKGGLMYAPPFR